jgi:iron complex outermembrane receptor protein
MVRAALLACVSATPALAQAEAEGHEPSGSIIVTGIRENISLTTPSATGSRLDLTPLETPATLNVIDGDIIRARGDLSIIDAVSRAPGVSNVGSLGNGNTALAARGFAGQGSVLQLIDGVRLFPVAGTITFPTDPWMVDRIDILSGPASVLYGQGALGGAVNVIMRQPNSARTEINAEAGYGSQNTAHIAAGAGGPLGDQFSYRVDASYRRSDGYVDRGDSRYFSVSGALRWAPTEAFNVALRHDYGDANPQNYTGTPLRDGVLDPRTIGRNYNVGNAQQWSKDNRTTLDLTWSPAATITVRNVAYRLSSKRFWSNLESYCFTSADGFCPNGYNGSAANGDIPGPSNQIFRTDNFGIIHDQVQWGDVGTIALKTPLGSGISNDLVVGFDVNSIKLTYSHDFNGTVQADYVDPYNPAVGSYLVTVGITPQFRTRTNAFALFAEDRLKLSDQFSIVGGVRYEHNNVKRWSIASGTDVFVLAKDFNNTTWRVGAVYQPTKDVSLYAQYSTGVDPLSTLVSLGTGQIAYSHSPGDQVEIGAKASFLDGHGTATIAAYRIVKKGLLSQRTLSSPIEQIGQRSAEGIEATLSLDVPGGFGIDANGSVLRARFDTFISGGSDLSGNVPPNIPQEVANLWLRWDATKSLQARAGLRYVGKRFSDNANKFRVPGYATVDATVSYALTKQVALDLHLYNLLDKVYAVTTYNDEQWILGRPRSFDLTLRASF